MKSKIWKLILMLNYLVLFLMNSYKYFFEGQDMSNYSAMLMVVLAMDIYHRTKNEEK